MRLVVEQIGLPTDSSYYDFDALIKDRVIEPDDLAMLQGWLMYELNLPEQGGYVSSDRFNNIISNHLKPFIRCRYVVAPMKIDTPLLASQIIEMTSN